MDNRVVVNRICSYLPVGSLLVDVVWVNQFFRSVLMHSNDIWRSSYALTWMNHSTVKLDPSIDWKSVAIMRYKREITRSPNLFSLLSPALRSKLASATTPEAKYELGVHIGKAHKHFRAIALKKMEIANKEKLNVYITYRKKLLSPGDLREHIGSKTEFVTYSPLTGLPLHFALLDNWSSDDQQLYFCHSPSPFLSLPPSPSTSLGPSPPSFRLLFARKNLQFQRPVLDEVQRLFFGTKKAEELMEEEGEGEEEGEEEDTEFISLLIFFASYPRDNEVPWYPPFVPPYFLNRTPMDLPSWFSALVPQPISLLVSKSNHEEEKEKEANQDEEGGGKMKGDTGEGEEDEEVYSGEEGEVENGEPTISSITYQEGIKMNKQAGKAGIHTLFPFTSPSFPLILPKFNEKQNENNDNDRDVEEEEDYEEESMARINTVRQIVRRMRFQCCVQLRVKRWLASITNEIGKELLQKITARDDWIVPFASLVSLIDSRELSYTTQHNLMELSIGEFSQFVIYSAHTHKRLPFFFNSFFFCTEKKANFIPPCEISLNYLNHMFVYAKGTVTSRKKEEGEEEEEEEREEEELDDKLGYPVDESVTAHIFAMLKRDLFDFPLFIDLTNISFVLLIKFLFVIGDSAYQWKAKAPFIWREPRILLQRYINTCSEAWEASRTLPLDRIDQHCPTNEQIRNQTILKAEQEGEERDRWEREEEAKRKEEADLSPALHAPFPIRSKPWPKNGSAPVFAFDSFFISYNIHFICDISQWPLKIEETGERLSNVKVSADGDKFIGVTRLDRKTAVVKFVKEQQKDFVITRMHAHKNKTLTSVVQKRDKWTPSAEEEETYSDHETDDENLYEDEEERGDEQGEGEEPLVDEFNDKVRPMKVFYINRRRNPPPFVGFVDGFLLLGGSSRDNDYPLPFYMATEGRTMEPVFKRTNLPLANCAFVVHLPHRENNKKYASEGLIVRTSLYQFNRESLRFERLRVFEKHTGLPFSFSGPIKKSSINYHHETTYIFFAAAIFRRNLFIAQRGSLYELSWAEDDSLVSIEHIPGIYEIQSIASAEPHGIIITKSPTFSPLNTCCALYLPAPLSSAPSSPSPSPSSPFCMDGELRVVPKTYFGIWKHADDAVNLVWSPPLSSLLAFEETFCNEMEEEHGVEGGCNEEGEDATLKERMHKESNGEGGGNNEEKEVPTVHALKMDDILRLPALKVKDLVDLQKVEKEREFGIYEHSEYDPFKTIPCSISRAKQICKITKSPVMYSCFAIWENKANTAPRPFCFPPSDLQIFDSLPELISKYLGGPVLYQSTTDDDPKVLELNVICDFLFYTKTSGRILLEVGARTSTRYFTAETKKIKWIGVLCPCEENQNAKRSFFINNF